MPFLNHSPSDERRGSSSTSTPTTMKLPQILRRGSVMDGGEKQRDKEARGGSTAEPERRSSLSALPLRLRRRKTQPTNKCTEQELEAAKKLGRLFFSLPSEIITEIVAHLTINDIYNLRLTSRTFNAILNYNASTIIRESLQQTLAPTTQDYIQPSLYRPPIPSNNLSHLLTMLRRQHILDRQIYNLLAFVQMKIYMTRAATRVLSVSDNRHRLIEAFQRPAWFVTHFLEQYRDILVRQHPSHTTSSRNCSSCSLCKAAAREVIDSYPAEDVMPAYHFYQLALEHLHIATRTPMSAGSLERRFRGWGKATVRDESLSIFVILGGIPEVRKVAMMQGSYTSRVAFVFEFVQKVREGAAANAISEERRKVGEEVKTVSDDGNEGVWEDLVDSLSPPFQHLTQEHITSLPDVGSFFYEIWKDRIEECTSESQDIAEPYPWLQRVMAGSGLEFGNLRTPDTPLALGASPV